MAQSPLVDTIKKWNQRAATMRAAGVDPSIIAPLFKYDINKVKGGGTGISNDEANLAIVSAASGNPVINPPKKKTGIGDILGNIPGDIEGIVKGFIPGLVRDVTHIDEMPGAIAHGAGEIASGDIAKGVQDIARSPGLGTTLLALDVIPATAPFALPLTAGVYGADVAAKATTPEGRQQMAEHPVGTFLEAFPALSEGGQLATAGREVEAGSAAEALQQGRPHAALARTLPAGKTTLDTGAIERATVSDRLSQIAKRYNIDRTTRELSRAKSIATRRVEGRMVETMRQYGERIGQHTDAEWEQFFNKATGVDAAKAMGDPNFNPLDPSVLGKDNAAILEMRKLTEEHGQQRVQDGTFVSINIQGKDYLYPADSNMAVRLREVQRIEAQVKDHISKPQPSDPLASLKYKSRLDKLQSNLAKKRRSFTKAIYQGDNVPAPLHDYIATRTRGKLEEETGKVAAGDKSADPKIDEHIRSNYQAEQIEGLTREIQESTSWQDFSKIVGEKNFFRIYKSTVDEALQLSAQGFDPLYLRHVPLNRGDAVLHPKPLSEGYVSDRTVKSRALNFAPHYHNAAIALTDTAREMLSADAAKEFVDTTLKPLSTPLSELKPQVAAALRDQFQGNPDGLRAAMESQLDKKFVAWDPSGPFNWRAVSTARDTDLVLPRHVANAIDGILTKDRQMQVQGAWDRTLKVYKFSVLTGPRHIVHVGIGGMAFMLLRDPLALRDIPAAFRMVKNKEMPPELPQHLYDVPGEHLWDYAGGKTMGRLLMAVPNAMKHVEEWAANVERAAVYLHKARTGLDVEAAALEATKVFVNLDDMVPLERTIIKNIMPFYAFTRHLFRYLFTYPVDHPVRAAVLSKFAEQEQADWNSGLPKTFQQLFFLGSGPEQTAVDFKAVNPFRNFGTDFSLAGLVGGMNPAIQAMFTAAGVNPLTATPELYPQISYDENTGSLKAERPHSGDWPGTLLEEFLPPTQALDHFIGFTDRMRGLRNNNPEAFRRQLFSALNLPFDVAKVNLPLAREKSAIARYQASQRAVSAGMKTGDFSEAERFNLVPFRGQLTPPDKAAAVWDQLAKALNLPGVSPKAVVPAYRGKKARKR